MGQRKRAAAAAEDEMRVLVFSIITTLGSIRLIIASQHSDWNSAASAAAVISEMK